MIAKNPINKFQCSNNTQIPVFKQAQPVSSLEFGTWNLEFTTEWSV